MTAGADPSPLDAAHRWARIVGLGLIVVGASIRAMVTHVPFPYWDSDPLTIPPPMSSAEPAGSPILDVLIAPLTGLGPTGSMLLDLLSLVGAALVLVAMRNGAPAAAHWAPALAAAGSLVALAHGLAIGGGSIEDLRRASSWIAGIWSAVAVWLVGTDPRSRRLIASVLLGLVVMLLLKGAVQVVIEHPATLESFRADRERQLASRGWEPDSSAALLYERRLTQAEATGWFGLANVYATVMAGWAVAWTGLTSASIVATRRVDARTAAKLALAAGGWIGLVLAGSKAGYAASAVGIGALALALSPLPRMLGSGTRRARIGSIVALGGVAAAIGAVAVRALIGPAWGELSMLFRSHYLRGAIRIILDHPVLGVGPDGFQNAYLTARPPISPEEVDSPHSILFDWWATLGIGGLAWAALLIAILWIGARGLAGPTSSDRRPLTNGKPGHAPASRPDLYWIGSVVLAGSIASTLIERGTSLPLLIAGGLASGQPVSMGSLGIGLGVLLGAVAAWIGAAWLALGALRDRRTTSALVAAAVALAVHMQLDMAPVRSGSGPLVMIMLAAWLGPPGRGHRSEAGPHALPRRAPAIARLLASRWPAAICAGLVVTLAAGGLGHVVRWEAALTDAARESASVGRLGEQIRALDASGLSLAQRRELARPVIDELARTLSEPPAGDAAKLAEQFRRARLAALESAAEHLANSLGPDAPGDVRTRVRAIELHLRAAQLSGSGSSRQRANLQSAAALALKLTERHPAEPASWSALARTERARAQASEPARDERLESAARALDRLIELNPYALGPLRRRLDLALERGEVELVRELARRLIEVHNLKRLDPVRGLSERELVEARRLAEGS